MDNEEVFYDESDKENDENDENNECDEFIRSWLEILVEDTNNGINNISGNQIDEDSSEFNALLENQIHPADNDDAKWDLTTLFKFGLENSIGILVNALKYWNTKTGTHVSGSNIPVNANPACT
ncbi:hypothetical protein RhiirA5_420336 [Rhizophagus irregularis]|uniref:Uncharacterized protein n=1 Tax=Rhizophagus irregularis TaxID=588596 RepID=A0A2N0RKC9_9GLOM|nr:hypothetical protein RhiirA5_420336 [Rhizophagus irregularis]PKC63738.1 hypothetical protein RhiirA1_463353 [Rhizophagus irregularis]